MTRDEFYQQVIGDMYDKVHAIGFGEGYKEGYRCTLAQMAHGIFGGMKKEDQKDIMLEISRPYW